jgi:hypothetical protein
MIRNDKPSLQSDGLAEPITSDDLPGNRALEADPSGPWRSRVVPASPLNSTDDEHRFMDEDIE